MFQNLDTWLVLLSLVVTIVALGAWIRNAGDDWLRRDDAGDSLLPYPAEPLARPTPQQNLRSQPLGSHRQAGA